MIFFSLVLALCFNSFDFEMCREHTLCRNITRSTPTNGLVSNNELNISSKLTLSLGFLNLNTFFLYELFFFFWNHIFFIDVKNSIVILYLSACINHISLCLDSVFYGFLILVDISI